jgi:hypothetical protein
LLWLECSHTRATIEFACRANCNMTQSPLGVSELVECAVCARQAHEAAIAKNCCRSLLVDASFAQDSQSRAFCLHSSGSIICLIPESAANNCYQIICGRQPSRGQLKTKFRRASQLEVSSSWLLWGLPGFQTAQREIKQLTDVVGIFSNEGEITRLIGALLLR